MALSHVLLALADKQPLHVYGLMKAFEEIFGLFWPLNYGQAYQALELLERKGLVESSMAPNGKKVFSPTDEGRRELEKWASTVDVKVRPLRDDVFLRIYVEGEEPTETMLDVLEEYRILYLQHLRHLRRDERDREGDGTLDLAMRLLLRAAIEHGEADVRWSEWALDAVRNARKQKKGKRKGDD